nr:unnamed protein product [Callosobruchus chinensis]
MKNFYNALNCRTCLTVAILLMMIVKTFIEPDEHDIDHPKFDTDVQIYVKPLSELRKKLLQQKSLSDGKHLSRTKMGCFVPPDVKLAEPEDTAYERRDWKIED